MKYGLLVNKMNKNIGDDIQSYAEAQFLPRVDVMLHREELDCFHYGDGTEPVAVIMGAWFMWRKFNWPPARQIIPLLVGYHHFSRKRDVKLVETYSTPIFATHYYGIGGQWFRDYGPVGCRDYNTCRVFDKKGIPNYFSGCVTLTLPQQPTTPDKKTYIVFADVNEKVQSKIRGIVKNRFEIRTVTHDTEQIPDATWDERKKRVEQYLTLYQNAKYVVTKRLHAALPCLAMGVPVLLINDSDMDDPNRFEPYNTWVHYATTKDVLDKNYSGFDFINGSPNESKHLVTSEKLSDSMRSFIDYCKANENEPLSFFDKLSYSDQECLEWKVDFLRKKLRVTHLETTELLDAYHEIKHKYKKERDLPPMKAFVRHYRRQHKKKRKKSQ